MCDWRIGVSLRSEEEEVGDAEKRSESCEVVRVQSLKSSVVKVLLVDPHPPQKLLE